MTGDHRRPAWPLMHLDARRRSGLQRHGPDRGSCRSARRDVQAHRTVGDCDLRIHFAPGRPSHRYPTTCYVQLKGCAPPRRYTPLNAARRYRHGRVLGTTNRPGTNAAADHHHPSPGRNAAAGQRRVEHWRPGDSPDPGTHHADRPARRWRIRSAVHRTGARHPGVHRCLGCRCDGPRFRAGHGRASNHLVRYPGALHRAAGYRSRSRNDPDDRFRQWSDAARGPGRVHCGLPDPDLTEAQCGTTILAAWRLDDPSPCPRRPHGSSGHAHRAPTNCSPGRTADRYGPSRTLALPRVPDAGPTLACHHRSDP